MTADNNEIISIPATRLDDSFDTEAVADEILGSSVLERFVPLTLWLKKPSVPEVEVQTNSDAARDILLAEFGESGEVAPVNAALAVNTEGKVSITPERPGAKIDTASLSTLFKTTLAPLGGSVTYTTNDAELINPDIRSDDLKESQKNAQQVIDRAVTLVVGDERVPVEPKEAGQWLQFSYEEKAATIGLNADKVAASLDALVGAKVAITPGKSTVALYDGNEVSRVDGPAGRAVDAGAMTTQLQQALTAEGSSTPAVPVVTRAVPPTVTYTRDYSKTQTGLQAYVRHLGADFDIRVSVQQLGGPGWSVGARQNEQAISASTYKLFVAIYVLRQIAENKASYDDQISGMSTRACLDKMIINSDNPCAEAFLAKFDAKKVSEFFWSNGYSRGTSMFFSDGLARTTTADLNKAVIELEQGKILSGEGRSLLLDLMGRQVYRSGVPAGTSAGVKNKVGFMNGYLNDAAIVSHPRGTYAISIITKGESWGKIAEATRQIESLMYP